VLLEGLNVVELSTWVAGPGCAAIMADWGASVIKVESAAGDPTRGFFPDTAESPGNPIFALENRGKRSIILNLNQPRDREAMLDLLRAADIFVTNLRPGGLARVGLDYETVKAHAPQLIYSSITGYGLEGPDADLPAFDLTAFWTRSGVAASTIPPDQEPFACRPGFGDHATGLATLSAILAALHERTQTGRGRLVETSLLRTAAYAIGWDLSILLRYGDVVTAQPRRDRPGPITGYFRTADGQWLCVVPRGEACFPAMMRLIGRADLLEDPAYAQPMLDLERVREVRALVDAAIGALTLEAAGRALTAADLIWAPMARLHDLAVDPQAQAAGCFVEIEDGWQGEFRSPAAPARFPEGAPQVRAPAPRLGQHTDEILRELKERR
jgi:crotonobetainyl-CoA:carnitine CoA-transferase CaiB-like acyl-CoA transferase